MDAPVGGEKAKKSRVKQREREKRGNCNVSVSSAMLSTVTAHVVPTLTDIHFQPGLPTRAKKWSTCSSGVSKLSSLSR